MLRTAAAAALLLAALAVTAAAQKDKDEKKAKLYKTPQEVFDAAEEAQAKKDYKTLAACYTPEAQKNLAALMASFAVKERRSLKDEKDGRKRPGVAKANKVLDKHGLTEKATKDIKFGKFLVDSPEVSNKASDALRAMIKDPEAFLADIMPTSSLISGGEKRPKAKLTGVKIDGDKATGTAVAKEEEREAPVWFVKVKGGWRIDPLGEDKKESKDKKDK